MDACDIIKDCWVFMNLDARRGRNLNSLKMHAAACHLEELVGAHVCGHGAGPGQVCQANFRTIRMCLWFKGLHVSQPC